MSKTRYILYHYKGNLAVLEINPRTKERVTDFLVMPGVELEKLMGYVNVVGESEAGEDAKNEFFSRFSRAAPLPLDVARELVKSGKLVINNYQGIPSVRKSHKNSFGYRQIR